MNMSGSNKPHLIITVGLPGSGKSFFAEHFSTTFKAPIISDSHIRRLVFGNPTFSRDEDAITGGLLEHLLKEVLKTERTVIYDGGSDQRSERTVIAKIAKEAGYDPLFIWVQTDPQTAKLRATKMRKEALLDPSQFEKRAKRFTPPNIIEKPIVISGKHTYTTQLKIILKHLAKSSQPSEKVEPARPLIKRNFLIR